MILSMTDFASKIASFTLADGSKVSILIELKTLNSRFFETTCKLSYSLSNLEIELISRLRKKFLRGHAYLTMHVINPNALQGSVVPDIATIEAYGKAIEKIRKHVAIEGSLSVSDLLKLPDVLELEEKEIDEKLKKQILKTVDELADSVVKSREQEGAALKKDLSARFATIKKEIDQIEKEAAKLLQAKKKEVVKTIEEIMQECDETAEARKSSLYIALDKMDVHEEIVRFQNHLENIMAQLKTPQPEKGKRLDFTLQELAREINTLSAKCSDAAITAKAINIKVELEKSREQTQNIV